MRAIALEVQIEAGKVEPKEFLALKRNAADLRAGFERAVEVERAALRRCDELGPKAQCVHCIHTPDREHTFLCGMHSAAYDRLKKAMAVRIAKQRALGEAEYALDRARKQLG